MALDVWSKKLSGLNGAQIKRGLDNLPAEFPPSPTKFRSLCLESHKHKMAAYREFPKLIVKKSDPEIAMAEMANIKQTLGIA